MENYIDILPITPHLVNCLKNRPQKPKSNDILEMELRNYDYEIGVGDVLNITVWGHPELTIPAGSYRSAVEAGNWVHSDGTIFYPFIGKLEVVGQTAEQVREKISEKLKFYIENPQVDVSLAAFRSKKVYITGEVINSGPQPITNVPLTLLEAVTNAGGLTKEADCESVVLTRNGCEEQLSLYDLMQYGDLTQNRLLNNGDIVYVPPNDRLKVFVLGEVNKPAVLTMSRSGMSLTESLSCVGGIDQLTADATGIFVIRSKGRDECKVATVYQLNMKDATALALGAQFMLQPQDVIYVTAVPFAKWNRVIQLLLPTIYSYREVALGGYW